MRLRTAIIILTCLCSQSIYGVPKRGAAFQATQSGGVSQTTPPAAKQYKLGQTIRLREGITLRVVSGGSKSIELFTTKQTVTAKSFLVDLEFEIQPPAGGEAVAFEWAERAGTGVFLNIGEARLMPKWWGWIPAP